MKNYLILLADIYKNFFKDLEIGSNRLSDYLDKIIVWIVSLSTGSIALIFASTGKQDFISQKSINITLIFLVLAIVSGIVGRGLSAISDYIGYQLNSSFKFELNILNIPYKLRKLKGDEKASDIYIYIKEDFETDLHSLIENIDTLDDSELVKHNGSAREFYQEFSRARKTDMDFALESINNITVNSFGLRKNYFDKNANSKNNNRLKGSIMRICTKGFTLFYALSMVFFLVAIIYLSLNYYCIHK